MRLKNCCIAFDKYAHVDCNYLTHVVGTKLYESIQNFTGIKCARIMGTMLLFNCETVIYNLLQENILKKTNNISVLHYDSFLVSIL